MSSVPDFTNCKNGYRSYEGSGDKRSIEYNGQKYILKLSEYNIRKNDLQTCSTNNVFSEYIGSRVFASMGIDVQETIIGTYAGKPAVACKDFTHGNFRLHEFSWLMRTMLSNSEVKRFPTYKQLCEVFNNHPMLRKIKDTAVARYWAMIIADSIIGNFARCNGDWGYLVDDITGDIKLAPVYDCGGSLYPSLAEEKMAYVLSSQEEIEKRIYEFPKIALNKSANPRHEDKFGYFELFSSGMDKNCTKALFNLYPNIDMKKINEKVENTPMLSDQRIEFYKKMMAYRKELIVDRARNILLEQGPKNMV